MWMMWALLLTVLNPTMHQLQRQLNPFLFLQTTMYYFSEDDHATHCTDVSVNKLPPSSSPKIKSSNKWTRLGAGGGMKGRLIVPYPTACWHWQMFQKLPPRGMQLKRFLSPSLIPPSEKLRVKPTICELWNNFLCPSAVCEGHFEHKWVVCQGK